MSNSNATQIALKEQSIRTRKKLQDKKDRLFKVLDNDPDLTGPQARERFGINSDTFWRYKREWQEARVDE